MDIPPLDVVRQLALDVVHGNDPANDLDEACDPENIEGLYELWSANKGFRSAHYKVHEAIEMAMIVNLGADDAVRLDDWLFYADKRAPVRRIKDPPGLVEYLGLSVGAQLAFRTSDLRVEGLRAFATDRGDDPDEVAERFIEHVGPEGPPVLIARSMEYAPRWALTMKMGERRRRETGDVHATSR